MITEDLSIFLDPDDFALPVVANGVSGLGIFDMPGEYVDDNGMAISNEYQVRCLRSEFGDLLYDDPITVNGEAYLVRTNRPLFDGVFCLLGLSKVEGQPTGLGSLLLEDGFHLLLEDGGRLLLES